MTLDQLFTAAGWFGYFVFIGLWWVSYRDWKEALKGYGKANQYISDQRAQIRELAGELATAREEDKAWHDAWVLDNVPAGSTLFVNDGEPRRIMAGDWYRIRTDGDLMLAHCNFPAIYLYQIVKRIDGPAELSQSAEAKEGGADA